MRLDEKKTKKNFVCFFVLLFIWIKICFSVLINCFIFQLKDFQTVMSVSLHRSASILFTSFHLFHIRFNSNFVREFAIHVNKRDVISIFFPWNETLFFQIFFCWIHRRDRIRTSRAKKYEWNLWINERIDSSRYQFEIEQTLNTKIQKYSPKTIN